MPPELTEGPYFVDEQLDRSDIREDPTDGAVVEGVPLELALRVSQINSTGCAPLAGAQVDVWHCDALGVYSDVSDPGFNTAGQQFLRGYQITDQDGVVRFDDLGRHDRRLYGKVTVADVRWICSRLDRLSVAQWRDAFRAARYEPALADRFIRRLRDKVRAGLLLEEPERRTARASR